MFMPQTEDKTDDIKDRLYEEQSKPDSGKIKRGLNFGYACYHSVQNLLFSRLLSENIKIRIYKTRILPVVLYGCETLSLTLREEEKIRVLENRVLEEDIWTKE
jgi:hypothetical protein